MSRPLVHAAARCSLQSRRVVPPATNHACMQEVLRLGRRDFRVPCSLLDGDADGNAVSLGQGFLLIKPSLVGSS
jgi:hypothetical protein